MFFYVVPYCSKASLLIILAILFATKPKKHALFSELYSLEAQRGSLLLVIFSVVLGGKSLVFL